MSIRRDTRTDRWYFRARVTYPSGKRDRVFGTPGVSGPFHDLPQTKLGAQEAERRAIAKAMTGHDVRPTPVQEVPTIREYSKPFLDVYSASHKPSSRRDKRQRLDHDILPAVGHLRLDALRQEHVDKIVADMLERECSRKQVNNSTGVLSALVEYAVTNKVIASPELSFSIKAQLPTIVAVPPDDATKLIDAATDPRYRAALSLAADAGLRIGEIRALPWLEVNEIARELSVAWSYDRSGALSETKGWERRTVPINDRLWSLMKALDRVGPLVFARLDGKPLGYDAAIGVAHEVYVLAGVTPTRQPWHALRHTFGTELANSGASIQTIQELLGHKSIETTLRYLHTTRDQKRAAVAGLVPSGSGWAADAKAPRK